MNEKIYDDIKQILAKRFKIDTSLVKLESNLESDLGLDSIELMDAISFIEAEFKIKLLRRGAVNVFPVNVKELIDVIAEKINENKHAV